MQDIWATEAAKMKQQPQQQGSAPAQESDPWAVTSPHAGESTLHKIATGGLDLLKGAGEGVLSTAANVGAMRNHIPRPARLLMGDFAPNTDQATMDKMHDLATPASTMQSVGKVGEQAAEFLIPGEGEEAAALHLAPLIEKIPFLGHAAPTLAKMATSAVGSGAVNKVQGGSFEGGAAAGAAGAGIGAGLKKIAPVVAETALKVRGTDRAYGSTPGKAILEETSGLSPRAVVDSARDKISDLHAEQGNLVTAAGNAGKTIDITPARQGVSDAVARAEQENHPGTTKDLKKLEEQLYTYHSSGQPILPQVHPLEATALNRGVSNAITSWNPATTSDAVTTAGKMAHHSIGESVASVVPEVQPLNQRIQSLMSVVPRGNAADLNAGLLQRISTRFAQPTGALAGAIAGFHYGGIPGAVGGLVMPEILTNPTTLITGARAVNSPAMRKIVIPAATGAGLSSFNRQ